MFNIGFTEMVVLGVLALVLIGPKQLPELARTLGRFMNEFKRSTDAFKDELKATNLDGESLRKSLDLPDLSLDEKPLASAEKAEEDKDKPS